MSEQLNRMAELSQTFSNISHDYRIAMNEFNDVAKKREQFTMRTEQQTNHWLHLSMGGLFSLTIFLLFIMIQHTQAMSSQLTVLNKQFGSETEEFKVLQTQAIEVIHTYPEPTLYQPSIKLQEIIPSIKSIDAELYTLNGNITKVTNELKLTTGEINKQTKPMIKTNAKPETQAGYIYPHAFPIAIDNYQ
ncbi:hypothetical protein [Candidatus Albibeggiatoa sp. nov. BB20]|uniref:hypothetical protein n=1 Tax=Candidatus Albibeggiatoa sp. nov. BB20 TaxID=3162723 RepID=UPI0033657D9F